MTTQQTEALRLAELLEWDNTHDLRVQAAAELRRLHDLLGKANALCRICAKRITVLETANAELLEALKQCDEAMTWELGGEPLDNLMIAARKAARAAIAKAEGETK